MAEPDQDVVQDIVSQRKTLLAAQPPEPKETVDASSGVLRQQGPQQPSQPPAQTLRPFEPTPRLRQYDMPRPVPDQFDSTLNVFKDPMVVLAGLSSLLTRRPLTAALNYAGSAMKGYHEGQKDVFEQNKAKFDEAIRATIAQNSLELNRYEAAWKERGEKNWEKVAPELYAQAAANNDQILQAAIKSGNWALVEKVLLGKEQAQTYLERAKALQDVRTQGPAISDDRIDFLARQGLTGNQRMLMGWFRFPQVRLQIEARMQDILENEQGMTTEQAAAQVARNTAAMTALQSGAGVLGRREAMVVGAINTAQRTGPRVLQALKGVDRTQFTDLNRLIRAGETRVGSPEEVRLGIAINTFINNYARASSSITGQTTDTARREATDLLQPYWAKGQIEAGIDQMLNYELPSELEAAQESVGIFTQGFTEQQQHPQGGGPKEGDRKQFKQGWGVFKNGQWVPENAAQ